MKGINPNQNQLNLFKPILKQIINPGHPLVLLAERIPWAEFEKEYKDLYSNTGRPAKPIRLMVSLLILKQLHNLGDETVVEQWVQNPYFQYFSGEKEFQWKAPCDPSDLVHFRKRIGEDKINKILEVSIKIQDDKVHKDRVLIDTTVQEKNITFPTDVKMRVRVIGKCRQIAKSEGIILRQSYKRTVKELVLMQRFSRSKKQKKKADKAKKRLKTIANRLIREVNYKLPEQRKEYYQPILAKYEKAVNQKLEDKEKVYSLHEPETSCIAKGKAHKKYEFGSKISISLSKNKNLILGVATFKGNPHDSQTLSKAIANTTAVTGVAIKTAIVDRGYQGKRIVDGVEICYPRPCKVEGYKKQKIKAQFKRRAAIEPVISHLKYDFGMLRNYLKGNCGDIINSVLACAAFNFKRYMRKLEEDFIYCLNFICVFFYSPEIIWVVKD
jgi:IS5 family transposase